MTMDGCVCVLVVVVVCVCWWAGMSWRMLVVMLLLARKNSAPNFETSSFPLPARCLLEFCVTV